MLTLIFLAIIISTQFSFGRFFAALIARDPRQRDAQHRRLPRAARGAAPREAAPRGDREAHEEGHGHHRRRRAAQAASRRAGTREGRRNRETRAPATLWRRHGQASRRARRARSAASFRRSRPRINRRRRSRRSWRRRSRAPSASRNAPLPPPHRPRRRDRSRRRSRRRSSRRRCRCPIRSRSSKAPAERRKGEYTLPPVALLDAAKTERKIDERELMDAARLLEEKCREFSVEGSVVQIHPGPGRHDLRVQAGRRA